MNRVRFGLLCKVTVYLLVKGLGYELAQMIRVIKKCNSNDFSISKKGNIL